MEKYTYTGPTMLVGENEEYKLEKGMEVEAEVDVNIATIETLLACGVPLRLDMKDLSVAAKYLKPVKIKPIHFDPKDYVTVGNFFDKLWEKIGKANAEHDFPFSQRMAEELDNMRKQWSEKNGQTTKETLDNIRKAARDANKGHEVGGEHYKMAIEPWDFIYANHIPFDESCIIKYVCRHKEKNGAEDIRKAISYCEHILKTQYGMDKD